MIKYDHVRRQREWLRRYGTSKDDGADEFAEANLYLTAAPDALVLTGLTTGQPAGQTSLGEGDAFLAAFAPDGTQ